MTSLAQGDISVPCWNDDGTLKPLASDDGLLFTTEQSPLTSIHAHNYGYYLAGWYRQPLMIGFSDRLAVYGTFTVTAAGTQLKTLFTATSNYVFVIKATMSINKTTNVVQNHLLYASPNYYLIKPFAAPGINTWVVNDNIDYLIKFNDKMCFQFEGCAIDDELEYACWGQVMKLT